MSVESVANPYPGLRPFEFPERHLFFGREGQSEELSRRLQQSRFLAVVGTSGSGKSSLVRAGLLPALYGGFMAKAGPRWRVAILRPGNDPIRNLAAALHKPAVFGVGKQEASPKNLVEEALIESDLRVSNLGLLEYLRKAALPQDENLLIVVDQFEELFRFKKESQRADADDEAAGFVKLLLEAMRAEGSRVYVVITMRSDFLGDCAQFRDLPEAINDGQYLIPRMTRDQLRQAIVAPAKVYNAQLTTRLVNRLLNDIGDDQDQLPILQHALMRTWDEWVRGNKPAEGLDFGHYEAIGGMAEALSKHADEAYEELRDERRKQIAEQLFKCLTEIDRENRETRRRTTVHEVCAITKAKPEEVIPIVDTFRRAGRTFIMPPSDVPLKEDSLLDISHESLIRNWKKLESWVKEEARSAQQYRRLVDAAELHEAGEIGHWRDPQLSFALKWRENEKPTQEWATRYHPAFAQAMHFLDESKAERDKEHERERKRQEAELERERELREKAQLLAQANLREAEKAQALAAARLSETQTAQALAAEQQRLAQIESENAEKFKRVARRLRLAVAALAIILLLASGLAFYAFRQKKQADFNAVQAIAAKDELQKEKANLLLAQRALTTSRDELKDKNDQLVIAGKKLETSLKTAEDEKQKAKKSEAEKAAALEKQKELTAEATAARDRAEKTLTREEKNRSGLVFFERGELQKAQGQFESLLEDYTDDKQLDPDKRLDGQWWAYYNLGAIHGKLGEYQLDEYQQASEAYYKARRLLGENPTGDKRLNLIATLRKHGQIVGKTGWMGWEASEEAYRTLLQNLAADDSIIKENPRYEAEVKREFADLMVFVQVEGTPNYTEAKKLYNEALQVYKTYHRDQNTSEIIRILNSLTKIAMLDNPADAKAHILEALAVRENEANLGPSHPDIAESYTELARFYQATNQPELAAQYLKLAERIRNWTFRPGKENSFPTDRLNDLAEAYLEVGRCDKASKVFEETVLAQVDLPSLELKDRLKQYETKMAAARFHRDRLKDYEKADEYFYQCFDEIKLEGEGIKDAVVLGYLDEIARFYHSRGKYDKAEEVFVRLYKILQESIHSGANSPEIMQELADMLRRLAATYEAENKLDWAEKNYREAIDLDRQNNGGKESSYITTVAATSLGNLYLRQGRDKEAEEYFKLNFIPFPSAEEAERRLNEFSGGSIYYPVQRLIGLGRIEERRSPNGTGSPAAIAYFEQALNALDKLESALSGFALWEDIGVARAHRLGGAYFEDEGLTQAYYNDRADVLESLAKYVKGEKGADLSKQAQAARQTAQRAEAANAEKEMREKQEVCPKADSR